MMRWAYPDNKRFTFKVLKVSEYFMGDFLSLVLPKEDQLSESTSAFLLGVSRLSAPRTSDPGESLRDNLLESSFLLQQDSSLEPACFLSGRVGDVKAVCSHLNDTFRLLLSMLQILIQDIITKRNGQIYIRTYKKKPF